MKNENGVDLFTYSYTDAYVYFTSGLCPFFGTPSVVLDEENMLILTGNLDALL